MKEIPLILLGYGNVGRALAELLDENDEFSHTGVRLSLRAVFDRGGGVVGSRLPARELTRCKAEKGSVRHLAPAEAPSLADALAELPGAILVDACPTSPSTGEPGLSYLREGLRAGHSAAVADKGPLIVAYAELMALARKSEARVGLSAAIGTPLPALETALLGLHGSRIRAFRGVFNQTANRVLQSMESGASYVEAVEEARSAGVLEADPRLDLEGWDAAFKVLILARALWSPEASLEGAKIEGIESLSPEAVGQALQQGRPLRLVGSAERGDEGRARITVRPERLAPNDPLFGLDSEEKAAVFESDLMGRLVIRTGRGGPVATAATLIKDVLNTVAHPMPFAL